MLTKKTTPTPNKLFAAYAHPDDETSVSGTLARAVQLGWEVTLLCATRGEAGGISDPALATPNTLGTVREGELRCACETIGIQHLELFDYRDSGMAGDPQNQDPQAYINAPDEVVAAKLLALLQTIQPHVVLTFEAGGIYGHPDHLAIHRHTTAAFHIYRGMLPTGAPAPALLYNGFPSHWYRDFHAAVAASGVAFDGGVERPEHSPFDDAVTHIADISPHLPAKRQALRCHRTQLKPGSVFELLSRPELDLPFHKEFFLVAQNQPWVQDIIPQPSA